MNKRKRVGRPQHEPTKTERLTVKHMAAAGIPQERIAACVGLGDDTLRRHFARELAIGRDAITGMAVGKLAEAIGKGEAWAVCFWLKTRAGFQERSAVEHSGEIEVSVKRLVGVGIDEI